ncbi:MAG: hypothetical protein GWN01_10955 [Nitrosopumilaceae archaeon]|nr:hypothetical protein [Nitrosopumilaceae archaeon]NIU01405.1 hypothetical protein [Nitrosopumilaceae archaeon]NIU87763.1 hypothetical protein [Nitrosopumilaceae archaeon]NIV66141.1 hypothetical protein [Nitrosopumilaceae archaeon]NIX62007.1 hypothetical protein [Nitrosopumilaceae archaeon]
MAKIDYNKAIINFEKQATTRTNFSYDPLSNKSYDVSKIEESKKLYDAYGNGKDPLYVIGVTNNTTEEFNNYTKKAYLDLQNAKKTPLLGQWVSPVSGKRFKDVSYVDGDISEDEAIRLKTLFNQESALKVYSNGEWELI